MVMGDAPKIGKTLLESPQVRKITFTGSTAVGKKLMAGAAETVKKVNYIEVQVLNAKGGTRRSIDPQSPKLISFNSLVVVNIEENLRVNFIAILNVYNFFFHKKTLIVAGVS